MFVFIYTARFLSNNHSIPPGKMERNSFVYTHSHNHFRFKKKKKKKNEAFLCEYKGVTLFAVQREYTYDPPCGAKENCLRDIPKI